MMKNSTYSADSLRELPAVQGSRTGIWNSFRSGFAEIPVGEDGNGPIQPADLLVSREAPYGVN